MSPRYVIAEACAPCGHCPYCRGAVNTTECYATGEATTVLDLPDAEHVHLHRQPDGSYTAVPMTVQRFETIMDGPNGEELKRMWSAWVDASAGGD